MNNNSQLRKKLSKSHFGINMAQDFDLESLVRDKQIFVKTGECSDGGKVLSRWQGVYE